MAARGRIAQSTRRAEMGLGLDGDTVSPGSEPQWRPCRHDRCRPCQALSGRPKLATISLAGRGLENK